MLVIQQEPVGLPVTSPGSVAFIDEPPHRPQGRRITFRSGRWKAELVGCEGGGLTSAKKTDRMARLTQWMMLANWKALLTGGGKEKYTFFCCVFFKDAHFTLDPILHPGLERRRSPPMINTDLRSMSSVVEGDLCSTNCRFVTSQRVDFSPKGRETPSGQVNIGNVNLCAAPILCCVKR